MGQFISRLRAAQTFPLQALPIELQVSILEECFKRQPLQARPSFRRGWQVEGLPDSNILLTSQYFSQIGCPIFDRIFDGRLEIVGCHQPCLCIALCRICGWQNPPCFVSHYLRIKLRQGIPYDLRQRIKCIRITALQLLEDIWVPALFNRLEVIEIICNDHESITEPPISSLSRYEEHILMRRQWKYGRARGLFYFLLARSRFDILVDTCCFRLVINQQSID